MGGPEPHRRIGDEVSRQGGAEIRRGSITFSTEGPAYRRANERHRRASRRDKRGRSASGSRLLFLPSGGPGTLIRYVRSGPSRNRLDDFGRQKISRSPDPG